jgi:hypothetical protein
MAKTKEKIAKKKEPLEVKTPYPKKEEKKTSDVDFIGEELVKLSNRINELELSLNDMDIKLKQVSGRMGL